uniref:Phosphoribosylformylglycinamidine synthase N-terminal domain-containing protein n=1 Tax=Setaria viridis TaxID=4556 RepID=A0A4U6UFE5_SETVI|nr:hypothetical protein SEVIR_5G140032v2 [Setaria viridis]
MFQISDHCLLPLLQYPGVLTPHWLRNLLVRWNRSQVLFIFYRKPFLQENEYEELLRKVQEKVACNIVGIRTEQCFNVELEKALTPEKLATLKWLLAETYEPEKLQTCSFLEGEVCGSPYSVIVEVGPRMAFSTAFSTNAVSICKALSLTEVARLERSRRYHLSLQPGSGPLDKCQLNSFAA